MEQTKIKITALYERLSRDDTEQGESNSIINQKKFLEDYAKKDGYKNIRHFYDDGVSGTTFDRDGFNKMIAEVEQGNVETIIVKDMSRLGRDYLKVGFYTEIMFKERGVRFIAVNNSVDSNNQNDHFTPFFNIMNEFYCRDTSRKIKAIFEAKMKDGKRVSPSVPYGYLRSPDDKQQLIVDEPASKIVKRIFKMVIEGMSLRKIADILCDEKVLIPSAYWWEYYQDHAHTKNYHNPYRWSATGIRYILDKKEYMGHTVLGKTKSFSYKSKKRIKVPEEEQLLF